MKRKLIFISILLISCIVTFAQTTATQQETPEYYNSIGDDFYDKNDYDNALAAYQKALEKSLVIYGKDYITTADCYNKIGGVYFDKGDYGNALAYYQKTLEIMKKNFGENHPYTAAICNNIGLGYYGKGDYDNALVYQQKSLRIIEDALGKNHPTTAICYNDISVVYWAKGEYDSALTYCKKAVEILEKKFGDDHFDTALSYNSIGNIYADKGDYDNALSYYQKSLAVREKILGKSHTDTAISYHNLGSIYLDKNDIPSAIAYFRKSHSGFAVSSRFVETIDTLSNQLFSPIPDPDFKRETLTLATDTVERARLNLSSMKNDIMKKSLPIYYYGVQFEAEQKNPKKSFEYSESLRSRGFLDQLGTETALKLDGITQEEKEQVQSLSAKITSARKTIEEQNSLPISERDDKKLSDAGTELANAEKSLLKLDEKIGKRIPAYAQLRNPKPISTAEAQKWCGKKRAVLEYVLWNPELSSDKNAKIKSYCIVLTNKKVNIVELDGEYDYTAAINKLRNGIKNLKRESQFENVRNELYEKLISPVSHYIGGAKELVIVPDGNLSFLPFDVLRKDESSKMLGDKYAVALSPSISVSVLSEKKNLTDRKMLAFGGAWYDTKLTPDEHKAGFTEEGITRGAKRGATQVDFELETQNDAQRSYIESDIKENGPKSYFDAKNLRWQDLPGTITELNALKDNVFTSDSFSEIVQEEASEKNLKRLSSDGKLALYPILHFACHGYFDNKISDMSSVLFSEVSGALKDSNDDGYLTISETALLNLNADLVCLSACETGLGEMKAGDGMVGLTRAFMVAGAKQVGASLWCVDDEATAKFMSSMYEKVVKNGMDYPTAYQKTKAEFRKDEDFEHPYYWSAFVLYE